jgi:hypothetical protein
MGTGGSTDCSRPFPRPLCLKSRSLSQPSSRARRRCKPSTRLFVAMLAFSAAERSTTPIWAPSAPKDRGDEVASPKVWGRWRRGPWLVRLPRSVLRRLPRTTTRLTNSFFRPQGRRGKVGRRGWQERDTNDNHLIFSDARIRCDSFFRSLKPNE